MINDIFSEYQILKKEQLLENWSNCLLHCGQFSELTIALIQSIYDNQKINKNQIKFNEIFSDLTSRKKPKSEDEILLLAVPNALKTIYTIRNKKRGAHVKEINPDYLDSIVSTTIVDWVMAQMLLLKGKATTKEISSYIKSIISKKIPLIEEFEDGTIMILNKKIRFRDTILLTIYHQDERLSYDELIKILNIKKRKTLTDAMKDLRKNLLVHQNSDGVKLSTTGLKKIEMIIEKYV